MIDCKVKEDEDFCHSRSQWPLGLRYGPAASRFLGIRFRIPPRACLSVCCQCCQVEVSATDRSVVQGNCTECVGDQLQHLPRHLVDLTRWRSILKRKKERKKTSAVNGEYQEGDDTFLKYTKKMGRRFPDESWVDGNPKVILDGLLILNNQLFALKYTLKHSLIKNKLISTPTCFGLIRPSSGSCRA